MPVLVGTSGWNYPGGRGTWNGIFYPARRPRGFDELAYYAARFPTVEVNSTFYRVPEPDLTRAWIARTPASFMFAVKLYQKFTHPDMYLSRTRGSEWMVTGGDLDQFRAGLDPLVSAGRMLALLIQFPPSFHADADTRAYLDWLAGALAEYRVVVELRHRSWSDEMRGTEALLAAHGATWAYIDEPQFAGSVERGLSAIAEAASGSDLLYVRLHGRNAQQWWSKNDSDRYDYHYTPDELRPLAALVQEAETKGRRAVVYFNNHLSAKAIANAAFLRHELGELLPASYERAMTERYPELGGVVRPNGLPI